MARKSAAIPRYRRKRDKGSWFSRVIFFLVKLVLWFLLVSVLWVLAYRFINPPTTATMVADKLSGRGAVRDWLAIEQIDRDMVRAAIAAEDGKFCQHSGFDYEAIENAMKRNASGGKIRGGSTISQQTAKTTFLWNGGGYPRKAVEAWFTILIEKLWGKKRIMEVYLNNAETGIGTYGVSAGAQRYFGHDARQLSATEAARIAAVLPLPKKRGAVAPKGFTRRYGGTIAARVGLVARDGLDACIYDGMAQAPSGEPVRAPKAAPKKPQPRIEPGAEYEEQPPAIPTPEPSPEPNPEAKIPQSEPPPAGAMDGNAA